MTSSSGGPVTDRDSGLGRHRQPGHRCVGTAAIWRPSADTGWFEKAQDERLLRILLPRRRPSREVYCGVLLRWGGYAVSEARDADEAMTKLTAHRFDLVIASLDLPYDGAASLMCQAVVAVCSNPTWRWNRCGTRTQAPGSIDGFSAALSRFDRKGCFAPSRSSPMRLAPRRCRRPPSTGMPRASRITAGGRTSHGHARKRSRLKPAICDFLHEGPLFRHRSPESARGIASPRR